MKKKLLTLIIMFSIAIATAIAQGPPGDPGDPTGDGGSGSGAGSGAGVPLDGGVLSVLLAAGVGYALSKRKKKNKVAE